MTFHFANLRLSWSERLRDPGIPPARETMLPPPLSADHHMLRAAYLSGQIEAVAWRRHLDADAVLSAHFAPDRSGRRSS